MNVRIAPNIFDYATSELSQDAFLCWLVGWLDYPGSEMNAVASDFIALMYNQYHSEVIGDNKAISPDQIGELLQTKGNSILQQFNKIDVYFRLQIDHQTVSFIVEDKTHTSYHSGQLKRYGEQIKKDGIYEDETIRIYFKTGYPFEKDRNVKSKFGFYPLFYEEWGQFLRKHCRITDPFFRAYRQYFERKFLKPFQQTLMKLETDTGHCTFTSDFAQYEFMRKLRDRCPKTIHEIDDPPSIETGTNRGGSPWTQYPFITFADIYELNTEWVFYRVDKKTAPEGKSPYYLSLRQYANINIKDPTENDRRLKRMKMSRLGIYQKIFNQCDFGPLDFEERLTRGLKESEIACLHFDSARNTIKNVLENIGSFHAQFVKKVANLNCNVMI